jgi:hypothetical protein
MKAGDQFENYLVVTPGGPGQVGRWVVYQLDVTPARRTVSQVSSGVLTACVHQHPASARTKGADFRTCSEPVVRTVSNNNTMQPIDPPWWIPCSYGCCTSGG